MSEFEQLQVQCLFCNGLRLLCPLGQHFSFRPKCPFFLLYWNSWRKSETAALTREAIPSRPAASGVLALGQAGRGRPLGPRSPFPARERDSPRLRALPFPTGPGGGSFIGVGRDFGEGWGARSPSLEVPKGGCLAGCSEWPTSFCPDRSVDAGWGAAGVNRRTKMETVNRNPPPPTFPCVAPRKTKRTTKTPCAWKWPPLDLFLFLYPGQAFHFPPMH